MAKIDHAGQYGLKNPINTNPAITIKELYIYTFALPTLIAPLITTGKNAICVRIIAPNTICSASGLKTI